MYGIDFDLVLTDTLSKDIVPKDVMDFGNNCTKWVDKI